MLKLSLQPGQTLWFISDPHYNHSNLCSSTTKWRRKHIIDGEILEVIPDNVRKFDSLDKMNNTIVDNINKDVQQNDILICLGDWSFGGFEYIKKFRDRIICKNIIIITGNHDHHIVNNRENIRSIFTVVYEYYVVLEVDGMKFVLCHYPIASWEQMAKGVPHLFGHVHLPGHQKLMVGKAMDVGMDGNNYKPYSLEEINSIMKNRKNIPLILPADHHVEEFVETK